MTRSGWRSRAPGIFVCLVVACGCGHSGGGGFGSNTVVSASTAPGPGTGPAGASGLGTKPGSSSSGSSGSSSSGAPPTLVSSIKSDFHNTQVAAGDYVWFSAAFTSRELTTYGANGLTVSITSSTIAFAVNGVQYDVKVPDATVTFSPTTTTASTSFDTTTGTWKTSVPEAIKGDVFLAGVPFQAPVDLPGNTSVTWTGTFASTAYDVDVVWHWSSSVYTSLSTSPSALGVKSVDDSSADVSYRNSDIAGTPENFKANAVGGSGAAPPNPPGPAGANGSSGTTVVNFQESPPVASSSCGCQAPPPPPPPCACP